MGTAARKHTQLIAVAAGAVFLLASIASLQSQETKSGKKKSGKAAVETKTDAKESAKKKPAGRLPDNYGKLDLTDEQRDKIYSIQAKTSDQIESLRKQLKVLEDKRNQDVEMVLTDAQKAKLKELTAESSEKRKARGGLRINQKAGAQKAAEPTTEKKK